MKTFTEYLQTIHSYKFTEILDDELSDHFDNWLSKLETDDLIQYADHYGKNLIGNYQWIFDNEDNLKIDGDRMEIVKVGEKYLYNFRYMNSNKTFYSSKEYDTPAKAVAGAMVDLAFLELKIK